MIFYMSTTAYAQYAEVEIGGVMYGLNQTTNTATVVNGNTWVGELEIPEQVTFGVRKYTVGIIEWLAFDGCKTLTKVRIPKTVTEIRHYIGIEDYKTAFIRCGSLERIEVDENNPSMCSVDGVLFSKDTTQLWCYPAGAKSESYSVSESVTWLAYGAFGGNSYLHSVELPNSVTYMSSGATFSSCKNLKSVRLSDNVKYIGWYTFAWCDNLKFLDIPESVNDFGSYVFYQTPFDTLVIRGTFPNGLSKNLFFGMNESAIIYVQSSEIEKFKKVYNGTVLPLEDYTPSAIAETRMPKPVPAQGYYDLQGRRLQGIPQRGMYIKDGKKKVVTDK